MYRIMIIDDEAAVRKLLHVSVNWKQLDMEIVGEAASGIEAINIIDELLPDICFVDIKMPFMDGIEFSKLAIERYPQVKIVILTAFDEFEYARKCIGIGVKDYLLKPIVKKDILEVLTLLKKELDISYRENVLIADETQENYSTMSKIKEYLVENYTVADLNLTKVALEFGFNSSYLSRKFKLETGESFGDFLFRLRMEQAKLLAEIEKPMYQTAALIGVPDPNYFSKCFKKYVGVTYSDYLGKVNGNKN